MSATLGWYQPGSSWLHRLDPRPKLIFTAAGTAALIALVSIPAMLAFLAAMHLLLLGAGVDPRRLGALWRILAPLLILISLLQPLFSPEGGQQLFALQLLHVSLGGVDLALGLRVTREGIALAVALALRLVAIAFCWYALLMTTPERDLVQGLVRLGLPVSWGLVLAMALRYPATLRELFFTVREAQQSRGLRLEGRGLRRARAHLPILIAMLVAALRSIERLAMALEARGFGGPARRSSLRVLRMRPLDWLTLAITLALALTTLGARLLLGFGAHPLDPWG